MSDKIEYLKIGGALLLPHCQGFFMTDHAVFKKNFEEWYPTLKQPKYQPGNNVLLPVWTTLYSTIGYASYLVYKSGGGFNATTSLPLALYGSQLALNWAWCTIFFKYKKIGWAAVDMGAIIGLAGATTWAFYKVNTTAGQLMIPYLLWLGSSLYFNVQTWRLNRNSNKSD